jgi:hypothetical protein
MFATPQLHSPAEQTVFVTRLHWWTLASGIYVAAAAGTLCLVPVNVLRTVTTMLFGPSTVSRPLPSHVTVDSDKGSDTGGFIDTLRGLDASPHVALKMASRTLDHQTTRHAGDATSQRTLRRVDTVFGWMNAVGGSRERRHRREAM